MFDNIDKRREVIFFPFVVRKRDNRDRLTNGRLEITVYVSFFFGLTEGKIMGRLSFIACLTVTITIVLSLTSEVLYTPFGFLLNV